MTCEISYDGDSVEIENAEELFVALDITPAEADAEILKQINGKISRLVTNDAEFLKILVTAMGVEGRSKREYIECFGADLKKVVTSGDTVSRALAILANESDQEYFLNTLGRNTLQNCVASLEDIAKALEWLYGTMDEQYMELIGWDFLINHIHTGEGLGIILKYLAAREEKILLDHMGWDKVLDCIQTDKDLVYVLVGLNSANENTLLGKLEKAKLRHIFPTSKSLEQVCRQHLADADANELKAKYE
ncbi:MAG: hypothetical protein JW822_05195 [Spirochaetales bacterium]|nr:hypothetical protein [Spirochaetales bacterium]